MPKDFSRTVRVADLIQRELAQIIQREMADKKIGMVTVSAVRLSKDYKHAKVYVTVLQSGDKKITDTLLVLNDAAPFLRGVLAHTINLRTTPQLRFVYDQSIEYGVKLSAKIDKAVAEDEQHHKDK